MRNLAIKLILATGLVLSALLAGASEKTLTIIHTNDFHGHIKAQGEYAGAARIAALIEQTRASRPAVLVVDAGDVISGTPVSTLFKGIPIFEVMNAMGYDAVALGNHEFDHGYQQIARFLAVADFPIVSANAFGPDDELLADAPWLVMTIDEISVAVIGIITDSTPEIITPIGNEGIRFDSPAETLKRLVPQVEPNVDLLIVLSHVGHEAEKKLAAEIKGIDIIIGGHSHTLVDPPVKIDDTWVVQADKYGTHVGYIEVSVDTSTNEMTGFEGKLIAADDLPAGLPSVKQLVKKWEANVEQVVDFEIATAEKQMAPRELQPFIEYVLAATSDADFGYYNIGGIRDWIRKGRVTARDIWQIEPFGNNLVTMTLPGSVLTKVIGKEDKGHPRLDEISPEQTYTVATNSFVASHAQRQFGEKVQISDKDVLVRDVLIDHLREHGLRQADK